MKSDIEKLGTLNTSVENWDLLKKILSDLADKTTDKSEKKGKK